MASRAVEPASLAGWGCRLGLPILVLLLTGCGPTAAEDRDCDDFDTHEAAQLFYEAHGGPDHDPHHLDFDRDGVACESLL